MTEELIKSTHEQITLWQPVVKSMDGNYIAILSDDSIDRDDEIIDKEALDEIIKNDGYTAILVNHENKIQNQIGEWINKRVEKIGEHFALVAEPKFYLSNPQAVMIKGMLDDGAKMGVSIGAIPHNAVNKKCKDGKERRAYKSLELLEASFVAIPSNRHGRAMAVAKMAKDLQLQNEVINKMAEEEIIAEPVKTEEVIAEPVVAEEVKTEEVKEDTKLLEEMKAIKEENENLKKSLEAELMKSKSISEEKVEVEKNLVEANNKLVLKAQYDTIDKEPTIKAGELPVLRK